MDGNLDLRRLSSFDKSTLAFLFAEICEKSRKSRIVFEWVLLTQPKRDEYIHVEGADGLNPELKRKGNFHINV